MKNLLTLLIVAAFLTGCCDTCLETANSAKLKTELNALVDQWHIDAANANLENYFGAISDTGIFTGTDATERWMTSEFYVFCKPHFDADETWEFHPVQRFLYISDDGNTAWFDELLETHMGLCRGSGILQKKGDQWKIEQYILSPTIPNDLILEVVEQKRGVDSLIIEKLSGKERK